MGWVIFVAGAVLSWGAYGALLHLGQTQLGNPLKALLCVGRRLLPDWRSGSRRCLELTGPALQLPDPRAHHRDSRRRAWRRRRRLHHLGVQNGWSSGLRDAPRLRRCAHRQRRRVDGDPSTKGRAQPDAVRRFPARISWRRNGVVLPSDGVRNLSSVSGPRSPVTNDRRAGQDWRRNDALTNAARPTDRLRRGCSPCGYTSGRRRELV